MKRPTPLPTITRNRTNKSQLTNLCGCGRCRVCIKFQQHERKLAATKRWKIAHRLMTRLDPTRDPLMLISLASKNV